MSVNDFIVQLNKIKKKSEYIEKSLIKIYLEQNNFNYMNSNLIKEYLSDCDEKLIKKVNELAVANEVFLDFDILVEVFELVIPKDESKENGMVYTPVQIKDFIIKNTIGDLSKEEIESSRVCDPACGCGSFLFTVAKYIHDKFKIKYEYIFKEILFGVDIVEHNIRKSKILLLILALSDGEIIEEDLFNLIVDNSLSMNWKQDFKQVFDEGGFSYIVGNPPYVRAKNINEEVKETLKNWKTSKIGNPDLYIPFYELAIEILKDNGRLGYISPNTFLKSVNGRALRKYLMKNSYDMKIVNFKDYQIFKNVRSYTCITIVEKCNSETLRYAISGDIDNLNNVQYSIINYGGLPLEESWNLVEDELRDNIRAIETIGRTLGDRYSIKNGIATLKNDIYIFTPSRVDNDFYYLEYEGREFPIEKLVCRDIVKPNIIKSEEDLEALGEKIIYPYNFDGAKPRVIEEEEFIRLYPQAYEYLTFVRPILATRAKGKSEELLDIWYQFGRTQGLNNDGSKIFIPYISDKPVAVLSNDDNTLFYCGYAIFVEDDEERNIIKKIILSDTFWYYIEHTSKPYSRGYMALAKNYIKNFGIPDLNREQMDFIINEPSGERLNQFIRGIYDVIIKSII